MFRVIVSCMMCVLCLMSGLLPLTAQAERASNYSTIVLSADSMPLGIFEADDGRPTVFGAKGGRAAVLYPTLQEFLPLTGTNGFSSLTDAACGRLVGSSSVCNLFGCDGGFPVHGLVVDLQATDNPATPQDERLTDLGTLAGGNTSSYATGINCDGVIVGYGDFLDNGLLRIVALKWTPDGAGHWTLAALSPQPGQAFAINAAGDITGHVDNHCVVWLASGGTASCQPADVSGYAVGKAINDAGQVAVTALAQTYRWEASTGAVLQPLRPGDTYTSVSRIAPDGRLVGSSVKESPVVANPPVEEVACQWDGTGTPCLDLNTQIARPDLVLLRALGITDGGTILTVAQQGTTRTPVLLVPDEPTRLEKLKKGLKLKDKHRR
jgi:uncharacterized membrane protein